MTWLFWITYLFAAFTVWILILVLTEDRKGRVRWTERTLYIVLALTWPLLSFFILAPVLHDWWTDRFIRKPGVKP